MKRIFLTFSLTLCCLIVWAIDYDKEFARVGFIDIQQIDSTIVVDLKYSSTDNFMGINMYGDLHKAYLRPEIAKKVAKAQKLLKEINSDYSLIIYDAARPISAQKSMFNKVKGTKYQRYVANPYNGGGHHNFGCAVDLTILYQGKPVDMGTDFDSFSTLSHIDNEDTNLKNGTLSKEAYNNRKLLRSIMKKVGFNTERCEWWHYDCYRIKYARQNFPLLDF
ncbi:MAG: peptidase M15 [Bacteroidales bacterium]|nr:peptidase M15 [Bacteroidales bacterium]